MNATIRLSLSSVLLMLAGGLAAYAPTASAQTTTLKSTGNGRCLAENVASATVVTQVCSGAAINPQIWNQMNTGANFMIRNITTNRCLNINAAGTIFTSACNAATPSQRWVRLNTGPTTARFRSVSTNRYLDNTAAGVVFSNPVLGGALQIWAF